MATKAPNYNEGQKQTIETLDRAVQVSAGAGAGKTFTLSRRLVHAFQKQDNTNEPFVTDPQQIMGITFTNKAAAELAHRVRRALKAQGMVDISRQIDEAWISTTDSMCGRMLKAHALKEGIYPEYEMRETSEIENAINTYAQEALDHFRNENTWQKQVLNDLVTHMDYNRVVINITNLINECMFIASDNQSLLRKIKFAYLRKGPKVLQFIQKAETAFQGVQEFATEYDFLKRADELQHYKETTLKNPYLSDYQKLVDLLSIVGDKTGLPRASGKQKAAVIAYQEMVAELIDAVNYYVALAVLDAAMYAREAYDKAAQQENVYDFTQVSNLVRSLLENQPELAKQYQEQFKIIMVDEFQDTNQLQIDIIKQLTDAQASTLCTVGDEQQSIYAFRGADVEVYKQHKEEMKAVGALQPALTVNYRSHNDILRAVDQIFMQEDMFGKSMLSLAAGRSEEGRNFPKDVERIRIIDGPKGSSTEDRAQALAEEFAYLRSKGIKANQMAVLLETVKKNASIYMDALRKQGFDVVIQGGSGFFETEEVQLITSLLECLANPVDDLTLLNVLLSDMFQLDETQLAHAVLRFGGYAQKTSASLWERLSKFAKTNEANARTKETMAILQNAFEALDVHPVANVVESILENTHYDLQLLSQGVDGKAQYANILKLIEMIQEQEAAGNTGIYQVVRAVQKLHSTKEPPAALQSDNAVKILTIHASKGLEFDVVGVGEVPARMSDSSQARLYNLLRLSDGALHFGSGKLSKSFIQNLCSIEIPNQTEKFLKYQEDEVDDFVTFGSKLDTKRYHDELQERYRKYYVAFTRAKECLVMVTTDAGIKKTTNMRYKITNALLRDEYQCGTNKDDYQLYQLPNTAGGAPIKIALRLMESPAETTETGQAPTQAPAQTPEPAIMHTSAHIHPRELDAHRAYLDVSPVDKTLAHLKNIAELELSYSSLHEDAESFVERLGAKAPQPAEPEDEKRAQAFAFGTAFHEFAEGVILTQPHELSKQEITQRANAYFDAHELPEDLRGRFTDAVELWHAHQLYTTLSRATTVLPEAPFKLKIAIPQDQQEKGFTDFMFKGSMDALVLFDTERQKALVVDYKTGYKISEEAARAHFENQAKSYAYACLKAGFSEVEALFYRIEVGDAISFAYQAEDIDKLEDTIVSKFVEQRDKTAAILELESLEDTEDAQ